MLLAMLAYSVFSQVAPRYSMSIEVDNMYNASISIDNIENVDSVLIGNFYETKDGYGFEPIKRISGHVGVQSISLTDLELPGKKDTFKLCPGVYLNGKVYLPDDNFIVGYWAETPPFTVTSEMIDQIWSGFFNSEGKKTITFNAGLK